MNKKQTFLTLITVLIVAVSLPVLLYEVPRVEKGVEVKTVAMAKPSSVVIEKGVGVTFKAGTQMFEKRVPAGSSVFDVMKIVASTTDFRFKAKEFSGLGFLVQEINGIKNEGGTYWTLYVNDQYSVVGASSYIIKNSDVIEWKYEKK